MSNSRLGYGVALGASVLVLVGSMTAVAAYVVSNSATQGTRAASTRPGIAMMGGGGPVGGAPGRSAARCAAPTTLPGTTVAVTVADMGMSRMMGDTAPRGIPMRLRTNTGSAPTGQVSFDVTNTGSRTHELVILPLADGQQAGGRTPGADGTVDETGSLGEASTSCGAGTGDGITAGSTGWVTLSLPAGRYELACNEANHYADGMWQELDVT